MRIRLKRKCMAAILTAAVAGSLLAGCGKEEEKTMSSVVHVDSQTAENGTLELTGNYVGTVAPNDSVDVTPMVSGTVKKVNVKVGDKVKEGDVLCKFDDTAAQLQLDSAKSSVESAQAGKSAANSQQAAAQQQAQSSIDSMEETLAGYQKSLKTAKKQLKQLTAAQKKLSTAMNKAKTAFTAAKTTYKKAQALYVNYKSFLNTYPDCQTTAGLTAAISAGTVPDASGNVDQDAAAKAKTASSLMKQLNSAGVTVEYLNDAGLNALKENSSDAETAYQTASQNYGQTTSSIASVKATIEQLNAQISATKTSISSAKKSKSMSGGGSEVYDAQIDAAEIGVESAEYQKSLYTVTAPIDGYVEAVNVTENEVAATGYPAFTISGKKTIMVTFYVTEEVKNFLQPGAAVTVDNNGKEYRGSISSVGTAVDAQKGLFKAEAQIFVDGGSISSGVSVSLSVVTSAVKDTIVIPYDAVYYDNNQSYVYCVEEGKAVRVDVTTGLYNDDLIAVTEGLKPGDEVITSWASGLKNGAEVVTENDSEDVTKQSEEKNPQTQTTQK